MVGFVLRDFLQPQSSSTNKSNNGQTDLDRSETPMDNLAAEAKEAAQPLMSMQATLRAAKQEVTSVFAEMEKQKEALGLKGKAE